MLDPVPHFSTFGKNYTRRFKDTDLFEQIFSKILEDCMKYKLVNTEQIFVDATPVSYTHLVMQQGVTHFWRTAGIKHFHLIDTFILQRNIWIYKCI